MPFPVGLALSAEGQGLLHVSPAGQCAQALLACFVLEA